MTSNAVERGFALRVTIDAKAHVDLDHRHYAIHRLDWAVAVLAFDAGVDVRPMREANEVGHRVHAVPMDFERRLRVIGPRTRHRLDPAGRSVVTVASHASRDRGNPGLRRPARVCMAVLTWDLVDPRVDSMTERDRLDDICARCPWPLRERNHCASEHEQEQGKRKHYAIHAHDNRTLRVRSLRAVHRTARRPELIAEQTVRIRRNPASRKQRKSVCH
jgi:hypothetical protein